MSNPISFLFDWLLGLTRPGADPSDVRSFIANPTQAASQAMGTAVTQAQLTQAASAVVAPAALYGGGNPIEALQHTVADNNGLTFAPQRTFAPETAFASHNDTALASGNDIGSPRAGEDVQQGVGNFDLDFDFSRDINASDGSTVNTGTINGDVDSTNVEGDGNVVGDDNDGNNTGDVIAGQGSNVNAGGTDNDIDDSGDDVNTQAGGDVSTNTGSGQNTQVGDIDTSGGGAAGGDGGHGGGGLINVGSDGGDGGGAAGGSGGGVIIAPTQPTNTNSNNQAAGDDINNVDASGSQAPVVVGNTDDHSVSSGGGDVTQADHVGGNVDASHDDNSTHQQSGVDVDLF
ncbi:hypothetical protein [Mycobacterium sp. ITM-2016-00318]|uniref:hypothetical protein n=1 Tax=Mycobacterium sp. ITM-2016-00318 TaxID=2099693 RepID=UPI000CF92490|nr:hypothetical protein [Mycobacterium sp. ITM-2016-00318]WNG93261.1 hypothetical protein C6A82_001880 [Mycobacterium sp. ITM-2016-00318]